MEEKTNSPIEITSGLDTFEMALRVVNAKGEVDYFESEAGESYTVIPLSQTDEVGSINVAVSTLWLHRRARWYWNFFSYSSDCWVWITDQKDGGNLVVVDKIEAHLTHSSCYGDQSVSRNNVSSAHAYVRNSGFAVCKSGICAWGCAEQKGYNRWCGNKWCG